jgi:tripartite-type tricarboxylate transporter receptor subunit TctC
MDYYKMNKRALLRDLFAVVAVIAADCIGISTGQAAAAAAQYPDRPIRLIVPYPAGGGADYWGRLVARELSTTLGQRVDVENIPGTGGNIGTAAASKAKPDGYTLLLGSIGPLAVHPYTYASLQYNAAKDFVPVALLESSPILLVAGSKVQAASATQLIDLARTNPGQLTYASNGIGSPEQIAGELFKDRLKLDIRHLPYDGAGPARKAVLAGEAALMFDPCKGALPAIRKGLQKPLAVAASTRLQQLPDVPTFREVGLPDYELRIWTGILAPAGTPPKVVTRLNEAIQAILRAPEIQKEIADEGGEAGNTTPAAFGEFIGAERKRWHGLVEETGIEKRL